MSKNEQKHPGVRRLLRQHGPTFLRGLHDNDCMGENTRRLADALTTLLKYELRNHADCELFWKGIKPALAGCPKLGHFSVYENILAYGFVHLLDRYLRVWEVMECLVDACVLPVRRMDNSILDIGSGPASALYAACDFYGHLNRFATESRIERLTIPPPSLQPIELSRGMCHFFHLLSEFAERSGPFGPFLSDFGEFDPVEMRERARRQEEDEFYNEDTWNHFTDFGEIRSWAHDLYRFPLVIFSNFLTEASLVTRFQQQIALAFGNQRRGGVVVVIGGVGAPYPNIYDRIEAIAAETGHRRMRYIPDVFDDSFRRPYFPLIKEFNNGIWRHLESVADSSHFDRQGLPPCWDPQAEITSLKSFAVRVYRRATKPSR